jgi:hypothetical protein
MRYDDVDSYHDERYDYNNIIGDTDELYSYDHDDWDCDENESDENEWENYYHNIANELVDD